jgi:hypothetical protein
MAKASRSDPRRHSRDRESLSAEMSRLDERSLAVDCPLSHFRDSVNGCISFGDEMPRQQLSAYKAQAKAKGRKAVGEAPKGGRKRKDAAPAHLAPPKIEAKGGWRPA